MAERLRLPRSFVARTLRFTEIPENAVVGECSPADFRRFSVVHNPEAMKVLADVLGLTEPIIRRALAVKAVDPQVVADAAWARLLSKVLSTAFLLSCNRDLHGSRGLRKILYPFLNLAQAHIEGLKTRHHCDWSALGDCLLGLLSDLLIDLALKTVLLEANILRQLRPETAGRQTTEFGQNFAEYSARSTFYVQKFYLRYAALSRLLAVATLQWKRNVEELLCRLAADRAAISADIFGEEFGLLTGIEGTLSDSHDGGRTVLFLAFDCGRRLVYKPRSLRIDEVFERLIALVAESGVQPSLRGLRLVVCEDYGWVELIRHRPIAAMAGARDFYRRQGINLALVQLLRGTDFHSENIIAEGEQPVLVDLEALLHPRPRRSGDAARPAPAEEWLGRSVFVSGLLPGWSSYYDDEREPDLSGLGGGQEAEFYRRLGDVVRHDDGGNLRIVRERIAVPQRDNRLMFEGTAVRPLPFVEDIVAGFNAAYDVLREQASQLVGEDLVSATCRVRYIALDTATYGHTLKKSLHPDFMRRSVHRELVAASLAYRAPFVAWAKPLLSAEIDAVFHGDIPKFTAEAGSTAISDHRGRAIPDYLHQTAIAALNNKIASLSESDRDRQAGIIRLAMATLCRPGEPGAEMQPRTLPGREALAEDEILAEAAEIGGQICAEVIVEHGEPDWVVITQGENGRSSLAPAGTDIYDGVGGIGLFLYEAGSRVGSARMLDLGRACGKRLAATMGLERFRSGGAYNGAASSAHALFRLGTSFGEPAWCASACEELARLRTLIESDGVFDLVGGSAGYLAVSLDVYRATGEPALREAAVEAAEFLMRKRVSIDAGIALPPRQASHPLTGFSHGAAGLGYVLLQLGAELGRDDLITAGHAAYDYEDALHDPGIRGYPDFRAHLSNEPSIDSGAWCHGAPGIALSRIAMPASLRRERDRQTVSDYLDSELAALLAPNDSLCHGEVGNAEILGAAARLMGNAARVDQARWRISSAIRRKRAVGSWRCGVVPRAFVPGAMIGLAGIGLGLLRACDPGAVRSFLVPCES